MNPNDETCSCRFRGAVRLHLCATECPAVGHFADELDYAFAIHQTGPLQLRLF